MAITNFLARGATTDPRRLIVLMHGVGANADDLAPVAEAMVQALPGTRVLLPDAPHPFEGGGPGFQWYSIAGATPENRRVRALAVLPEVVAWIERQRSELHLTCEQLVLAGFSQGAILALAAAAGGLACGRVVSFSGRLIGGEVAKADSTSPRIFLGHGESDAVIPVDESRDAADRLKAAGFGVELRTYRGLGHGIAPDELAAAIEFLKSVRLGRKPRLV